MEYLGIGIVTSDAFCHFEKGQQCDVYKYEKGDICLDTGVKFSEKNYQKGKCFEYQLVFGNKFQIGADEDDFKLLHQLDALSHFIQIYLELERAEIKHPNFPHDIFRQLAIMQEEAGEVTKAVLHFAYEKGSINDVREELIQTAAMCVRMLKAIENM